MEYIILLIFSFFTEAVILWQYAASLFSPSHSGKKRLTLLSVLYVLLFFLSLLGQTWLNIISFFVINTVFLYIMFNLKLLLALFHSAILTAIMGISELAVLWFPLSRKIPWVVVYSHLFYRNHFFRSVIWLIEDVSLYHEMLNSILCRYQRHCNDKHIIFHTDIRSGTVQHIYPRDLTSLFCNLLENAVE